MRNDASGLLVIRPSNGNVRKKLPGTAPEAATFGHFGRRGAPPGAATSAQ